MDAALATVEEAPRTTDFRVVVAIAELPRPRSRVLVVEDDVDIRSSLQATLADEGYEVATADNGLAALDHLRTCSQLPFVILLDLRMPVMDGHSFLAERRLVPMIAGIPVIVLTAEVTGNSMTDVVSVLRKPFALERLLDELSRLQSC